MKYENMTKDELIRQVSELEHKKIVEAKKVYEINKKFNEIDTGFNPYSPGFSIYLKCIESYTTATHFGGIFLGQSHINQKAITTPICDFSYIDTEYFGNEHLGENTVQEKIIKLGGL